MFNPTIIYNCHYFYLPTIEVYLVYQLHLPHEDSYDLTLSKMLSLLQLCKNKLENCSSPNKKAHSYINWPKYLPYELIHVR